MKFDSGGGRWRLMPVVVGMFLLAAGAADGHELVTARNADWPLLIRADLEWLGGVWLLSGRFSRAARIIAVAAWGGLLAHDVARAVAGVAVQPVFGRVIVGTSWAILGDLLIVAGLLGWRASPKPVGWLGSHPVRSAMAGLVAALLGIAIDRSQAGQFPIISTVRAGRTSSGLDYSSTCPTAITGRGDDGR
jgi:hypothetical protein